MRWLLAMLLFLPTAHAYETGYSVLAADGQFDTTNGGSPAVDPMADILLVDAREVGPDVVVRFITRGSTAGDNGDATGRGYESSLTFTWQGATNHTVALHVGATTTATVDEQELAVEWLRSHPWDWQVRIPKSTPVGQMHVFDTWTDVEARIVGTGLPSNAEDVATGGGLEIRGGLVFQNPETERGPRMAAGPSVQAEPFLAHFLVTQDQEGFEAGIYAWDGEPKRMASIESPDRRAHDEVLTVTRGVGLAPDRVGEGAIWSIIDVANGTTQQIHIPNRTGASPSAGVSMGSFVALPTQGDRVSVLQDGQVIHEIAPGRYPHVEGELVATWNPETGVMNVQQPADGWLPFKVAELTAGQGLEARPPFAMASRPDGLVAMVYADTYAVHRNGGLEKEQMPVSATGHMDLAFDGYGNAYVLAGSGTGAQVSIRSVYGHWFMGPTVPLRMADLDVTRNGTLVVVGTEPNGGSAFGMLTYPSAIYDGFAHLFAGGDLDAAENGTLRMPAPDEPPEAVQESPAPLVAAAVLLVLARRSRLT